MKYMKLEEVLNTYMSGTDWSWEQEFEYLETSHENQVKLLKDNVAAHGMLMPVMLGDDGRIWDGHHRIYVAKLLGLTDIPVQATEVEPTYFSIDVDITIDSDIEDGVRVYFWAGSDGQESGDTFDTAEWAKRDAKRHYGSW